jgi:hypothetical protein
MPKISQFPAGGAAQNTDLIPVVRNGGDYTITGYNLAALASYGQAYTGTFTATAGQTVFTLPASPGSLANLAVSVDGAVMVPGTDYTWTTPTTLTFTTGLSAGQTVLYRYTTSVPVGTAIAGGVNGQLLYNNSGIVNGFASVTPLSVTDGTNILTSCQGIFIGNNASSGDSSAVLVGRGLSGSLSTGAHAYRDESTYTSPSGSGLFGYSSFDSIPTIGGSVHWNHAHSYQARIQYTGSGTNDEIYGFGMQLNHTGSGTVTNVYGVRMMDALGSGTITNQVALWVDPLTRGSSNYVVYSLSTSVPSYHGGRWQVGNGVQADAPATVGVSAIKGTGSASSYAGQFIGGAGQWTALFSGNSTSGSSLGPLIQAGTTAADTALMVQNQAASTNLVKVTGVGNTTLTSTSGNTLTVNANGGNYAASFVGASGNPCIVAYTDGNTGNRIWYTLVGSVGTGIWSLKDATANKTRVQVDTNGLWAFQAADAGMTATFGGSVAFPAPNTQTGTTYTVAAGDYSIIFNGSATCTLTLPTASSYTGRMLIIKTVAAFTVVSASSNVVPLAGGAAGTAILAGTAGKFAYLQSDGTNWITMMAN